MSLNDLVHSTVSSDGAGLKQTGFGIILALDYHTKFAERARYYEDLSGMTTDGFATGDPLYKMAARAFSQEPRPDKILVGRIAATYAQTIKWIPTITTVGYTQSITVEVQGVKMTAEFINADTVVANIISGMMTAVQALDAFDANITVTNQTTYLRIVSTAGLLVGYSDWTGKFEDVTADVAGGIDAQLDAIKLENDDWYGLALAPAFKTMQQTAATWIEANKKLAVFRTSDWQASDSTQTVDIGDTLMGLSYARSTVYFRKHASSDFIDIGAMGERFPSDPGQPPGAGGTWFGKTIKGVLADDNRSLALTPTEKANLRAKNYTVYESTAGRSHTLDGKTASGEFVDVTRFLDWVTVRIQEAVATVELNAERVPYTDGGIASLAAQVSKIMDLGVIAGGFSDSPYPKVTAPLAASVPAADKTSRTLNNVHWAATLAGAIHLTNVSGTASV